MSEDYMVKHFDLEELAGSDQITSDADISVARLGITRYSAYGITGVIPHPVLCRMTLRSPCIHRREAILDTA